METKLLYQPFDKIEADAVAVVLFEDEPAPAELKFASAWLDELKTSGEFSGTSFRARMELVSEYSTSLVSVKISMASKRIMSRISSGS